MAELDIGRALFALGEVGAAVKRVRRATEAPDAELRSEALAYLAVIVPGSPRDDNRTVLEVRREWVRVAFERQPRMAVRKRPLRRSNEKLRIGYVSAFFGSRNWMKPVWGVVNNHDRSAFEIHLFADRSLPSAASGYRAHRLDRVHDATRFTNDVLARRVARAGIDVLVDLNAYSFPERLGLFVHRPAPVVVGWFNTYATTGLDSFDAVIGDAVVIPEREERFYTERVLRVPGTYLAFSVLHACPKVTKPPCLERRRITFGSFCSQYKMTDEVVAAWSAILRGAPKASLLVKNRALGDPSNRARFLRRFERCGIAARRVLLEGPAEHTRFIRAYAKIDVALDTFPYSGGTTTMEALWQGVPVLTFGGDRWASRTSASLLDAAGLRDWCAPDRRQYVERAVAVANATETPDELALLRRTMRRRLRASTACDSGGLVRSLEDLYRELARICPR